VLKNKNASVTTASRKPLFDKETTFSPYTKTLYQNQKLRRHITLSNEGDVHFWVCF
jgi:hypothetical protein